MEEQKNESIGAGAPDIDKLKEERDQYLNGWKRSQADLINYKNEESKRVEGLIKFGNESILEDVVSVLDNVNRAIFSTESKGGKADESVYMIKGQLEDLLRRRSVIKIEVKSGDDFDPMYHEAIAMTDPVDGLSSGKIAEIVESGYKIHERVLKPARVKVVK